VVIVTRKPYKLDALIATADWLGAYECDLGPIGPILDTMAAGDKLRTTADLQAAGTPADMIAAYRLAVAQVETEVHVVARRLARKRIVAQLGPGTPMIGGRALSNWFRSNPGFYAACAAAVRAGARA